MVEVRPVLASDDGVRAVYAAHGPELFRFALRSLGDRGLAEEAVQETFVRAWQAAERFDDALGSLRTWLFAIIRNVVIDLSRARAVRPALAAAGGDGRLEVDANPNPLRSSTSGPLATIVDGCASLSDAPGLGTEPDLAVLDRYAIPL